MPGGILRRFPVPSVSLYTIITITLLVLAGLWAHNTLVKEKNELLLNGTLITDTETEKVAYKALPLFEDDKQELNNHKDVNVPSEKDKVILDSSQAKKEKSTDEILPNKGHIPSLAAYIVEVDKERKRTKTQINYFNLTEVAKSILNGECSHFNGVIRLMTYEPICLVVLANAVYCLLTLVVQFIQQIVFGQLRAIERQHMKEKFWNFVFYKFIFVFGVMNVQSLNQVLVWVTWFAAIVFLLLLTKLCKDRFEFLSFSPNTPMCFHWKVCFLLVGIELCCILLGMSCVMNASPFQSFSNESFNIHAIVFMLTECIIIFIKALHVIMRYAIHLKDVQCEELWEQKATLVYHVDLSMEMLCLCVKFVHHLHMLLCGNVWLSMASLVICMQLRYIFSEIQKRFQRHKNYRRVVANMEAQFPEATTEELIANEDQCAICWDQMETARRLPCGHLFHAPCLRSWLEQDTTCPTCRKQLDIRSNSRQDRQNNNIAMAADEVVHGLAVEDNDLANPNPMEEGDGHHTNHLWHFDGSRFASWLPSFYVEVMHSRTGADAAGIASIPRGTNTAFHLDAMVREVTEVFPQIPSYIVRNDLRRTGSVEATTDNILEGRLNLNDPPHHRPNVQATMSLNQILNPASVERLRRNLFSGAGLRRRNVGTEDRPNTPQDENTSQQGENNEERSESATSSEMSLPHLPPPLASSSSSTPPTVMHQQPQQTSSMPSMAPVHFSKAPTERQRTLQARQQSMVREARLRYLAGLQKKKEEEMKKEEDERRRPNQNASHSNFPLAKFNTNVSGSSLDDGVDVDFPPMSSNQLDEDSDLTDESLG